MTPPASASRPHPLLPLALLVMIGGLWGLFYALIKTAVTGGVSPVNYVVWFTFIAATLLLLIGRLRGSWPRTGRRHVAFYFKTGLVRFTVGNILLYAAQGKLPVGVMAVLMTFVPIFTCLFSLLFRVERPDWVRLGGILLGFCGVLLIVVPRSSLPDPELAVWVLIGLGAPLLHAASYVMLSERNRPPDADSLSIACGTLYAATVMTLPLAIAVGHFRLVLPPFTTGELAMIAHATLAAFNFYAIFELIRLSGPTYMSQANFLSVAFGVVFGMLFFAEQHSLYVWGAMGLTVAGVALVNVRQKKAGAA